MRPRSSAIVVLWVHQFLRLIVQRLTILCLINGISTSVGALRMLSVRFVLLVQFEFEFQ
ncbi:unnamed protein product [Nesidiocoris tenuis]|uniref:Uncharacterized protein n=1 Tax=Nesidiocoris tenuis TaxID=355587 RepID=A0A6H5HKS6_9HEMI|nr:unnamed protein product [Nesidiocoris tenuis]